MSKANHTNRFCNRFVPASLGLLLVALLLAATAATALAGPPTHPRREGLDIGGLNHPCGAAVDSEGDVYVSSAGESKVKVFNPEHTLLTSIANANEPCGLAVDGKGSLYVSEQGTGNIVRYKPNAYPFTGTPSYGAAEPFDTSGKARGIAVDPTDDRLYVAEGDRIAVYQSDGTTGQNEIEALEVKQAVTAGAFTLEFKGQVTAPIAYDAKPSQIQAALEALSTIGAGNVSVEEGNQGTRSYLIAFTHALGSKEQPNLKADSSALVGGEADITPQFQAPGAAHGFEFDGHIAEGELDDANAVVAYTYDPYNELTRRHYLFVADSATDEVETIAGATVDKLKLSASIDGSGTPQGSFGFGAAGAALALDWSNGHVFVYDDAHSVLDEFDASGRYLDQVASPSFSDAAPTGVAVLPERSSIQEVSVGTAGGASFILGYEGGQTAPLPSKASTAEVQAALEALPAIGAGNVSVRLRGIEGVFVYVVRFAGALADRSVGKITLSASVSKTIRLAGYGPGRVYVTAGAGAGAKLLALGPLAAPSRAALPEQSNVLKNTSSVAVDSHGNRYVLAGQLIHVYGNDGSEIKVGPEGKGFEDPNNPIDLAVDSSGVVYVLDANKGAGGDEIVTYYTPTDNPPVDGTTYARHEPPVITSTGLNGGAPQTIAIDPSNDHLLAAGGDLNFHSVIFELASAAEGSGFIREFAPGFNFVGDLHIDVDGSSGNVYIAEGFTGQISVVNAAGTERLARISGTGSPGGPVDAGEKSIAVDQSNGHVLTFAHGNGPAREYDASGAFVAEFAFPEPQGFTEELNRPDDIAIDNSGGPNDGNAYVAFDDAKPNTPDLWAFAPLAYGEVPLAATGTASTVGAGSATLNGTINPHGFALEGCSFEYLGEDEYLSNGKTFAGAGSLPCAESPAEIGQGGVAVPVHADLSGLEAEARYRFRLVAENQYGSSEGAAGLFGPPLISAKPAKPILYGEARLHGEIDPSGLATKYHFEYGTSEGYGQSTPAAGLSAGDGAVAIEADLGGLKEGTTYHFRLVAENEAGPASGPDQTLSTLTRPSATPCGNVEYRTGLSAKLPDCRAYELVTPAETNGLAPIAVLVFGSASAGFNNSLVTPRGAGAGERLSYFTLGTLPGFEGNGFLDGYRAERGAGAHPPSGWSSTLFGPSFLQSGPDILHTPIQQSVASDQLYSFWKILPGETFPETLAEGIYLRTPTGFEPVGEGSLGTDLGAESRYVSPGGTHVIFYSDNHLEKDAAPEGTEAVYDRVAGSGTAKVVSLKADGSAFGADEDATYIAASEDGSAILFKVKGTLYLRRGAETSEIAEGPNTFAGISANGKRVLYAATGFGATPSTLYACDTQVGQCVGEAEPPGRTEIAKESVFLNVSAEGSAVLFTSKAVLGGAEENDAGEIAEAGERNLYAWDVATEATHFVAQLDPQDFVAFGGVSSKTLDRWTTAINPGPDFGRAFAPTRSTPGGGVFVFESHARLTAYDNEGRGEVYRYDPAAAPGERVLCVSCDPSGTPPSADAVLADVRPGDLTTGVEGTTVIPNLTDAGTEVFFHSRDRLLPEDANGAEDVYEWKAKGAGECKVTGGCLALISSGQGEVDSYLYGMSTDGRDVFFGTREKLVGGDVPGSPSLYDARVEGGIPDQPAKEACRGDACQGDGSSSPALSSPASSALREAGNASAGEGKTRCGKGRHAVRRGGKTRCLKAHHKHRHRQRQANHNRRAGR